MCLVSLSLSICNLLYKWKCIDCVVQNAIIMNTKARKQMITVIVQVKKTNSFCACIRLQSAKDWNIPRDSEHPQKVIQYPRIILR